MKKVVKKACLCIGCFLVLAGCRTSDAGRLSMWRNGAKSKTAIIEVVEQIQMFYPREDWIAVFDFDGTLFCEKDPTYYDWWCAANYINENPKKFTAQEKKIARRILQEGRIPGWTDQGHGLGDEAFVGLSLEEYKKKILEYAEYDMPSFSNLKRKDAFFLPMLQLVKFLQGKGFKVFVCTGTERRLARMLLKGKANIPMDDIIGSSYELSLKGKDLYITGTITSKNLKEAKIATIENEIGKKPLLVFGNSSGDYAMGGVYNNLKTLQNIFMVVCDDETRDCGNKQEAEEVRNECMKNGWIPISMRNDWYTVYGDGVTKRENGATK